MANTIIAEVYREEKASFFDAKTKTNTVAADIAKITDGAFNDRIEHLERSDAVVSTGTGKVLEVDISNFTTSKDSIVIEDFLAVAEPEEFVKDAYSIIDLGRESMEEATRELTLAFDAKVILDALAQTTTLTTATQITTAAEATTASLEIQAALAGYAVKPDNIAIVMDNAMFKYFLEAGADRVTTFGDRVLETGSLYSYMGMDIYVVRAGHITAGEILAVVKGNIDVYVDKLKFMKRQGQATVATKASLWDVNVNMLYMEVKIWNDNLKRVVKLAA
jgi:hypothetical protein